MHDFSFLENNRLWLIVPAIAALYFLGLPVLVKSMTRMRRHFKIEEIAEGSRRLPAEISEWFYEMEDELQPLGFQPVRQYLLPDVVPNAMMVLALFENRTEGDAAAAVVAYGFQPNPRPKVSLREQYVEFSSEFADGSEICTKNGRQESAFKTPPRKRATQLPDTHDVELLYAVHRYLVEQYGVPPKKPLPTPEEWVHQLRDDMTREFREQVEAGILTTADAGKIFVPTWIGACLMTWKQLWPIAPIRRARLRHAARQLLAEVNHFQS